MQLASLCQAVLDSIIYLSSQYVSVIWFPSDSDMVSIYIEQKGQFYLSVISSTNKNVSMSCIVVHNEF